MITSGTATNAAVTVTLVGQAAQRHKAHQVTWSYSAAPTNGRVNSSGLQGDELDFDVTAGGPGGLALPPSSYGGVAGNVTFTLAAGGSGIVGKLNVFSELE